MAKRKIIFLGGSFKSMSHTPKDTVTFSTLFLRARFDQVLADALDIKTSIFDDAGHLREGMRKWILEVDLYGPMIDIVPESTQTKMFEDGRKGLAFKALHLSGAEVIRLKEDGALRINFSITMAGSEPDTLSAVSYLIGIRKGDIKISVTPASKEGEAGAMADAINYGLFKKPKEDGEDMPPETGTEGTAEDDDGERPTDDEPPDLRGSALASFREMRQRSRAGTNGAPPVATVEEGEDEHVS